jgi:hypothetical protein
MTEIHITDDHRQALHADNGKPLEVVDPFTQRRYVLLPREQYEHMRSHLPPPLQPASPPTPAPTPEAKPLRQRIRDLPLPPEVAAVAKRWCKELGYWGKMDLREKEEQLKLQHYYGGMWIACLETEEGLVVVAAAECLSDPVFDQQLSFLTAEERRRRTIERPRRLFDTVSEI